MNLKSTKLQPSLKGKIHGNILPSKLQIINPWLLLVCFFMLPFQGQAFDFSGLSTKKRKDNFFQRTFITLKATVTKNLLENESAVVSMNMALMPETIGGVIFRDFQNDGIIGVDDQRFDADELPSCLLYTSPSPRDATLSRMPSSA